MDPSWPRNPVAGVRAELKHEVLSPSNRTRAILLFLAVLPPLCGAFTLPFRSITPKKIDNPKALETYHNLPLSRHFSYRSDGSLTPVEYRSRRARITLFSGEKNDCSDRDQIKDFDGSNEQNDFLNSEFNHYNSQQNAGAENNKMQKEDSTTEMNDEHIGDKSDDPGVPLGLKAKDIAEKLQQLEEMKSSLLARKEEKKNEQIEDVSSGGSAVSAEPPSNQTETPISDSDKSASSSLDESKSKPVQFRAQLVADIDEKEAWIQEQNRLVEERRLARLEMEKQIIKESNDKSSAKNASANDNGSVEENPSPKLPIVKIGNYDFNYYDITQNFPDARRHSRNILTDIVSGRGGNRTRFGDVEANASSPIKGKKKDAWKDVDEFYFDITQRVYPKGPSLSTATNVGPNQESSGARLQSGVSLESTLGIPLGRSKMLNSSDDFGSISDPSPTTSKNTRITRPQVQTNTTSESSCDTANSIVKDNMINMTTSRASEYSGGVESEEKLIVSSRHDEYSTVLSQQFETEEEYFDITRIMYPERQSLSEKKQYDNSPTSRRSDKLSGTSSVEAFFDITQSEFADRPSLSNFAGGTMSSEKMRSAQPKSEKTQNYSTSRDVYYDITQNSFPGSPSLAATRRAEAASMSFRLPPPVSGDYFHDITRKLIPERSLPTMKNAGATLSESPGRIREFHQKPVQGDDTQYFDITRTNIPTRFSKQQNSSLLGKSRRGTESIRAQSQQEDDSQMPVSPPIQFVSSSKPSGASKITPFVIPKSAIWLELSSSGGAEKPKSRRSVFRVIKRDENVDVPQAFISDPNPNAYSNRKNATKKFSNASGVDVPRAFASNPADSFHNMKNMTIDEIGGDNPDSSLKYLDVPAAFAADPKDSFRSKTRSSSKASDRDNITASTKYVDIPKAFLADPAASTSNIKNFTRPTDRNDAEGSTKYVDTPAAFYANPAESFSNIKNTSKTPKRDTRDDPDIPGAFLSPTHRGMKKYQKKMKRMTSS